MSFAKLGLYFPKESLDAGFIRDICRLDKNGDGFGGLGDLLGSEIQSLGRTSNENDAGSTSLSPCSRDCLTP